MGCDLEKRGLKNVLLYSLSFPDKAVDPGDWLQPISQNRQESLYLVVDAGLLELRKY